MQPTPSDPQVVRFGEFVLHLRSGELAQNGTRVLLPDQLFRVLALLVSQSGALVTREELRHELWRDDTFVDFEHGLNAAIKRLREALGDSAASPRFIETLPRRGYRFIAAVERETASDGASTVQTATPPAEVAADSLRAALGTVEASPLLLRAAYATAAALVLVAAAVWGLGARGPTTSTPSTAPVAVAGVWGAETPVIAVLPFRNLSSEPDSDYFVDGLTEEIIRNLAVVEGLQVRSQTSSFFFKNKPHHLASIADQLRVNLIVTGSVQREDKRLRINAELVPVASDVPLWSDRYDRTREDVFAIQDEISRAIVNKLRLTLGRGQRRYQPPVEAYEVYLRARTLVGRRGTENAKRATELFEQVIAKDPAFAPAHAGLAGAYAAMSWEISGRSSSGASIGLSFEEGLMRTRPAAMKAIELDPLLAEAHAAMGITYSRERDWENAQKSFDRAIELNPSLTQIHTDYSHTTLLPLGKLREAQQLLDAALTTDPLSLEVRRGLAVVQITAGRYDDAIANLRHVLAVDPEFPFANLALARALTFSGRAAEAVAHWESAPKPQGDWQRWLAHAYVMLGRDAEVQRLVEADKNEHPYRQALIYAALGDKDRTFEALNRAADILPHRTASLLVYPEMAFLRGDPRLDALRKKLNLP